MSGDSVDGDDDRPRGILTSADREFLRKSESERQEDYSRQSRSDARTRIRERAGNAIRDFELLHHHLDADDRAAIFEHDPAVWGVHGMLAFLWQRATDPHPYDREGAPARPPEDTFGRWLEGGIYRAQTTNAPRIDGPGIELHPVEVRLEVENLAEINLESIDKTIRTDGVEALTENELLFLLWLGRRGQVADKDLIPGTDLDTVITEFTDRKGEEWGLHGQIGLPHGSYDEGDRAERANRREQNREGEGEGEPTPDQFSTGTIDRYDTGVEEVDHSESPDTDSPDDSDGD